MIHLKTKIISNLKQIKNYFKNKLSRKKKFKKIYISWPTAAIRFFVIYFEKF